MKNINKWLAGSLGSLVLLGAQSQASSENVTTSIGLDYNSHFMSYGANVWGTQTDDIGDEITFNPSIGFDFALSETSGIYTGVWADVNDIANPDPLGGSIQEIDYWLGYYFAAGDFTIDFTLQQWIYASEVEGIFDINIGYDAKISPSLTIHNRIEGVGTQNKGTMLVLGGSFYSGDVFSVSANIGGSLSEYHVDGEEGYAFSSVTLGFGVPIPVAEGYGDWDFHGGLTFYHTSTETVNNPEDTYLTLNLGVGMSF